VQLDEGEEEESKVAQEVRAGMRGGEKEQEGGERDRKVYYKTATNRGKR